MTFDALKQIIVDTLGCDADKVTPAATLTGDLEVDSLDAVELNMAIEDTCGASIPDSQLAVIHTVQDLLDAVDAAE